MATKKLKHKTKRELAELVNLFRLTADIYGNRAKALEEAARKVAEAFDKEEEEDKISAITELKALLEDLEKRKSKQKTE